MTKIYRVYAYDRETGIEYNNFYATKDSKAELILELEKIHEGSVVILEVVEYSIEAAVDLLNLHIE